MKNIYILLSMVTFLSSCTIYNQTASSNGRNYEVNNPILTAETKIMDYKVDLNTRLEGKAEGALAHGSIDFYKEQALTNANKNTNCDFLVNPIYTVDQINNNTYIKVSVVGYPAKYTELVNLSLKDTTMLKYAPYLKNSKPNTENKTKVTPTKKGGGAAGVLLTLGLLALVIAIAAG